MIENSNVMITLGARPQLSGWFMRELKIPERHGLVDAALVGVIVLNS